MMRRILSRRGKPRRANLSNGPSWRTKRRKAARAHTTSIGDMDMGGYSFRLTRACDLLPIAQPVVAYTIVGSTDEVAATPARSSVIDEPRVNNQSVGSSCLPERRRRCGSFVRKHRPPGDHKGTQSRHRRLHVRVSSRLEGPQTRRLRHVSRPLRRHSLIDADADYVWRNACHHDRRFRPSQTCYLGSL